MSFYLTCAIDYPNSRPHVGTAYEKIAADMIARYRRLAGEDVYFLMGLDEHSQNVERKAREEGLGPQEFCDRMEGEFRRAWAAVHVEYDGFIRTTEARHRRAVEAMVERADAAGDLYESTYEGWYCVSCEAYYLERDLEDGMCPVHGTQPAFREEENVFFRLSAYADRLRRHIDEHPDFVRPDVRRNEIVAMIDAGLEDISVSRRSESGWGIPMPNHPGQAVYVWFDALTNYLSAVGFPDDTDEYHRYWPADMHLVGKDITRFHAVIWPAMLMSAGVPLPRTVFGHGWVLTGGGRMSKTIGNVMDPIAVADEFGADALRFFLLREVAFGRDLEFDHERLTNRYNADLANDLGNLVQRTLSMVGKYRGGELVALGDGPSVTGLPEAARGVLDAYRRALDDHDLQGGINAAWRLVADANLAIDSHKPWELARDEALAGELDGVLAELVATLRQLAVLLYPVMPERCAAMAVQLGVEEEPVDWRLEGLLERSSAPRPTPPGEPLFPRREVAELAEGNGEA